MAWVYRGALLALAAVVVTSCGGGGSPSSPTPVSGGSSTSTTSVASTTTSTSVASTTTTSIAGGTTSTTVASTTTSSVAATTTTVPAVTVAYNPDVKAVLDADCVRCHSASVRNGNVDLSSYTAVMRVVTPGSANSILVRVTQSGGSMYSNLSGSRTTKAALIRSWVVDNAAAQSR